MKTVATLIAGMVLGGIVMSILSYAQHATYASGYVVNVEKPIMMSLEDIVHTYDKGDHALAETKVRRLNELWHDHYGSVSSARDIYDEVWGIDFHDRPIRWESSSVQLGDSGYEAAVGPMMYQDMPDQGPDYYSIEVDQPDGDVSHVLYHEVFPISTIPIDVMSADAVDLVRYDEDTRTVIFDIGEEEYRYILPVEP